MLTQTIKAPEFDMVMVPAGVFIMGRDGKGRESPAHPVTLTEYQIGRFPVTNAQYLPFVQDMGYPAPLSWDEGKFPEEKANHPVSGVVWADAWLYCAWLKGKTGKPYHLPTETEWEKAAIWNPQTARKQLYPWGDEADESRANLLHAGLKATTPVGAYSPRGDSPYGCADMIGNVDEWCNTVAYEYPYVADDGCEEPLRPGRHATRGGDWYSMLSPATSRHMPSETWASLWGFRVALGTSLDDAHAGFMRRVEGVIADAEKEYQAKIKTDPTNAQLWFDFGTWYLNTLRQQLGISRPVEAERTLSEAIRLIETAPKPLLGKPRLNLKSPLAWVYYNRATARAQRGKYQAALSDAQKALTGDASDTDTYILCTSIECSLRQWQAAEQHLSQTIRLKPDDPANDMLRPRLWSGRGEHQRAVAAFTQILSEFAEKRPWSTLGGLTDVYLWRGQAYEEAGQLRDAISDYRVYVLWRPDAPEATELSEKVTQY